MSRDYDISTLTSFVWVADSHYLNILVQILASEEAIQERSCKRNSAKGTLLEQAQKAYDHLGPKRAQNQSIKLLQHQNAWWVEEEERLM